MKQWLLAAACLSLSACVPTVSGIDADKFSEDSAFLVLDMDMTFDGASSSNCDMTTELPGKDSERVAFQRDTHLTIMQIKKPGAYNIYGAQCMVYKVLWNKVRRKNFATPLMVNVEAGTITYPGTIVGDWDSESMRFKDLFNNGGAWTEDEGSLVLKREDRSAQIRAILEKENPAWLNKFKFTTKTFEPNDSIVQ